MPIDKAYEQNNELVKGSSWEVTFTQNRQLSENGYWLGLSKHSLFKELFVIEKEGNYFHHDDVFQHVRPSSYMFFLWWRLFKIWVIPF